MSLPLPDGKRLAVPPMRKDVPHSERQRVLDLVARGQFGLAYDLACDLEEMHSRRRVTVDAYAVPDEYLPHIAAA